MFLAVNLIYLDGGIRISEDQNKPGFGSWLNQYFGPLFDLLDYLTSNQHVIIVLNKSNGIFTWIIHKMPMLICE